MFIMKKLLILSYFFRMCLFLDLVKDIDINGITEHLTEVKEEESFPNDNEILNATMFKTVKKYYCRSDTEDGELLVYGTRAWTFPPQNVNLTLRYPEENQDHRRKDTEHIVYIMTGLKVVFHLSGSDSRGYITSGGMNQDHISMMFNFRNITSLSYQFYLYGVPRITLNVTENYTVQVNMC